MSSSDDGTRCRVHVTAGDPATELFLVDEQFRVVANGRGAGKLDLMVKPGVYSLRARAGNATHDEVILVENSEVEINLLPVAFSSPVPASPAPAESAPTSDVQPTRIKTDQSGSSILISATRGTAQNAVAGLELQDANGRRITAFEFPEPPQAATGEVTFQVPLQPGVYLLVLNVTAPEIGSLCQSVVASAGFETRIYLRQRKYPFEVPQIERPNLPGAAVLMRKLDRPVGDPQRDPQWRATELARIGLANRRYLLSNAYLDTLLNAKFDDPMLGIFGAHLMLLDKSPDMDRFRIVVGNLRRIVGDSHPDVEALATRIAPDATLHVFSVPPMLRASWDLAVEASAGQPRLVPAESVSAKIYGHIWGEDPWLVWTRPEKDPESDYLTEALRDLMEYVGATYPQAALGKLGVQVGKAVTGGAISRFARSISPTTVSTAVSGVDSSAMSSALVSLRTLAGKAVEYFAGSPLASLTTEQTEKLVQRLGVPRSVLENTLRDLRIAKR